jgi:hypothetical protein
MKVLKLVLDRNARRIAGRIGLLQGGSWYGNDTAWRMALDLAQLVFYADATPSLYDVVRRKHLSIIDGIIGGEGEGPLSSTPVNSGVLIFGDDVAVVDALAVRIMGYDPLLLPIVSRAFSLARYPISTQRQEEDCLVIHNGVQYRHSDVAPVLGRQFRPPNGWVEHLRYDRGYNSHL